MIAKHSYEFPILELCALPVQFLGLDLNAEVLQATGSSAIKDSPLSVSDLKTMMKHT